MKFKVTCPECEATTAMEVDTSEANNGDVYNDIFECPSCKKPSILQTKITANFEVLPVASEPVVEKAHFAKRYRIKRILESLEKELT